MLKIFKTIFALVAQLDRAFGYEPKGRGFESLQAHFKTPFREFFIGFSPPSLLPQTGVLPLTKHDI